MRFKTFTIIIFSMIISGCAPSLNSQLANWKQQIMHQGYNFYAAATSSSLLCSGYMAASVNSMSEAENLAIRNCNNQPDCTGCYIVARNYTNNSYSRNQNSSADYDSKLQDEEYQRALRGESSKISPSSTSSNDGFKEVEPYEIQPPREIQDYQKAKPNNYSYPSRTTHDSTKYINNNVQSNGFSLDSAKTECEDLGFKKGTEKFGECVLKLAE